MFNIFRKSKPKLSEIIPNGFIDIHSHVLPGIDDGAKDVNEAMTLISNMKKLGFSKVIGTPHVYPGLYENNKDSIKKSFESLIKYQNSFKIEVDYGAEYMIDRQLIKLAEKKNIITINDDYILIEIGFIAAPMDLYDIIFQVKLMGYKIIIAHPERYIFYFNNFSEYFKLKDVGCFFQLNLTSLVGHYGEKVSKISDKLIKNNLIEFVGSDVHNLRHINFFDKKLKIKNIKQIEKTLERNNLFE